MVRIIFVFIIIALGVIFSSNALRGSSAVKRKCYVYFIIVLSILQSGLRNWAVGSDTYQYYYRFEEAKQASWQNIFDSFVNWVGKDPFYQVFTKLFQFFCDDYQIFLLLVAAIFMLAVGHFILNYTTKIRHAVLAFVIYQAYFYGIFSVGIRQTIAAAFLLWSFDYIKDRKFLIFLFLVLIAALFHITALVFLPLYFIANLKRVKLIFGLSLLGFPIIMYFKNELVLFSILISGTEERFAMYAEQFERGGSVILTLFNIMLGIFALAISKFALKQNSMVLYFYNTFAVALFFYPLQWLNPNLARVSIYFAVVMMVWIPYLLDAISGNNLHQRQLIYLFTIVLFIGLTAYAIVSSGEEYKFFWQYMPRPY